MPPASKGTTPYVFFFLFSSCIHTLAKSESWFFGGKSQTTLSSSFAFLSFFLQCIFSFRKGLNKNNKKNGRSIQFRWRKEIFYSNEEKKMVSHFFGEELEFRKICIFVLHHTRRGHTKFRNMMNDIDRWFFNVSFFFQIWRREGDR